MLEASRSSWLRRVVVPAAFVVLVSGCAGGGDEPSTRREPQGKAGAVTVNDYDPGNFSDPTNVDNRYSPRKPGMRWVWEGKALDDEGNPVDRRVEMVVSDMTKVLNGVPAVVAIDKDYNDGEIGEYELIFFSQDDKGTVWLHGYYSEEWEEGKRVGASGWLGGVQDAKSGIYMHAQPAVETPAYEQGIPPVEHEAPDYAEVFQTGQRTCTPLDCYQNVVVTREWHPSEPGVYQLKYYAPGVGNVRIGYLGPDDPEKEQMTLTEFVQLGPEELAKVREEVLALEERAYKFNKDFYGGTEPAEQLQAA
jgi:hypothetical protein